MTAKKEEPKVTKEQQEFFALMDLWADQREEQLRTRTGAPDAPPADTPPVVPPPGDAPPADEPKKITGIGPIDAVLSPLFTGGKFFG